MRPIIHDSSPDLLDEELERELTAFNEHQVGPRRSEQIALSVRDEAGRLLAGLTGEIFWNVLYIDKLWVESAHRGQHYGQSLVSAAELIGRGRGCDIAYLNTFGFQAPAFYTALGYRVFGELAGAPSGSKRIWLSKALAA